MNPAEFSSAAERFADISRQIIQEEINKPREIEVKEDATPVTLVDQAVERALRTAIEQEFPTHGIIGEEFDDVRRDADYIWVLDPIDGTKAFMAGFPVFGTLIALTFKRLSDLGCPG